MPRQFSHYISIDWSGAKGSHHKSIAMAIAHADGGPPVLVERERGWSREEILAVLRDELPDDSFVGVDLGVSLPFCDCGDFFPGYANSPSDARELWALIDRICAADEHLSAGSFVSHPELGEYFHHGHRKGEHFGCDGAAHKNGRLRVAEHAQAAVGLRPTSNFKLVGASQVGKSSLTGMRVLHALQDRLAVWPIDPLPHTGSVIAEIYTSIAALAAGRTAAKAKIKSREELDAALVALGSPPVGGSGPIDDHSSDALITAAWMRGNARRAELWQPAGMTRDIARTEGWTFGVP
ncbi:hypothetical protein OZN62_05470 [Aurantiacibacter sp. MUD11]|uniref:hypothetical protein n=1 Tax=Aurantiacibacter sp. MUD11 TaxID=3003265 RepID=UPI0022AACD1A|nr:hypothetical protein [Aurantiacibacter sp. MUD11]WAT19016.1 hypothetical protein OZN62_05470 [Aurantiacibacter sp. MUD11]